MLGFQVGLGVRHETLGAATGTSTGTTLTGGTANTDGAWFSVGTAGFNYAMLHVTLVGTSAAADYVVDVGIDDGAGNKWIVAADLRVPSIKAAGATSASYPLPLSIPAGALLYARCASTTASATVKVLLTGCSAGFGGAPGFSRCVALYTTATSRGFVWDPGATANTDTGWQQISAGVASRIGAVMLTLGANGATTRTTTPNWFVQIGAGASGAQWTVAPRIVSDALSSTAFPAPQLFGPFPADAPASAPWWIRGQCRTATATTRVIDIALHGFVV